MFTIKKKMKKTAFSVTVMALTLTAMTALSLLAVNFSSIYYILIAGVLGLSIYLIGIARQRRGEK